jgi:hypothetical protein
VRGAARLDLHGPGDGLEDGGDLFGERGLHLLVRDFAAEAGAAEAFHDALAGGKAEVRRDERFFQLFQRFVVQAALAEEGGDAVRQARGGALEAAAQA